MATSSPATTNHPQLAKAIADACVLRGTFTLRSGRTSSYYIDKYLFSTKPAVLKPLGDLFAAKIAEIGRSTPGGVKRLAGAELGGIPLVTVASLATGLPSIFIRNAKRTTGPPSAPKGRLRRVTTSSSSKTSPPPAVRPSRP
ncbi:MAG: hypothetical protein QM783_00470 [Phycisphaerales bacterium]